MARYIDANIFLDLFYVASAGQDKAFIKMVETVIEETPNADVAEVKRGYWKSEGTGFSWCYVCSECGWKDGYPFNDRHKLCPNCGARMDDTP